MARRTIATGLAVAIVFGAGLMVALPARQAYDAKAQSQELAGKILAVCAQGGDAAAPLVAIKACPLAQQVQATTPVAAISNSMTADEIQALVREEIARQMPKNPGGSPLNPQNPPGAAGPPGREHDQQPAPDYDVRSTNEAQPPAFHSRVRPPVQFQHPSSRRERQPENRYPPERTVVEQAPPPVTVTSPPTATVTASPPAPVTQTVEQPVAPAQQQGVPLLNGVGGLLNGLGSGL